MTTADATGEPLDSQGMNYLVTLPRRVNAAIAPARINAVLFKEIVIQ